MKPATNNRKRKILSSLLISSLLITNSGGAFAAESLWSSATVVNATPGQVTEDLVLTLGVDWDYDAGVKQSASNGAVTLDRAAIQSIINDAATVLYGATESRHLIKKVYVYKNAVSTNYDITLVNATIKNTVDLAGWGKANKSNVIAMSHEVGGRVNGVTSFTPTATPITNATITDTVGLEVARGLASYLYGLASEGSTYYPPCGGNASVACDADVGANSLMNPDAKVNGNSVHRFTTPTDYYRNRFFLTDAAKARLSAAPAVTAQQRVWATSTDFGPDQTYAVGASGWEMLARPLSQDPKSALGIGRQSFPALADYDWERNTPTGTATPPVLPQVVFVSPANRKDVIVLDVSGAQADVDNRIGALSSIFSNAAASGGSASQFAVLSTPPLVDGNQAGSQYGLVKIDCRAANSPLVTFAQANPATGLIGAGAFKEISFSQNMAGGTNDANYLPSINDLNAIYTKIQTDVRARSQLPNASVLSCYADSKSYSTDNAIQYAVSLLKNDTTMTDGGFATIHFVTSKDEGLSPNTLDLLKANKININTVVVNPGNAAPVSKRQLTAPRMFAAAAPSKKASAIPTGFLSLNKISNLSGGNAAVATNGADAAKKMNQAVNALAGNGVSTIASESIDPIASSTSVTSNFYLASGAVDKDVTVNMFFDSADITKVTPSLIDPSGQSVAFPAASGVTGSGTVSGYGYAFNTTDGTYDITIPASQAARSQGGTWGVTLAAGAATVEYAGIDVVTNGGIGLAVNVTGGTIADTRPLLITATLGNTQKVINSKVTADIYDADGNLVLGNVTLKDDGTNGDFAKADGTYTVQLGGQLPLGDYSVSISVDTSGATFDDGSAVEEFTRVSDTDFSVEDQTTYAQFLNNTGTAPNPNAVPGHSSGGGCTTDPLSSDASLLLLLGFAGSALALRKRKKALKTA